MVTIRVKGGTPEEGSSLCITCSWGVVRTGFRAAESETFCQAVRSSPRVPFKVRECTSYEDRRIPSLYSMEKIGWALLTKSVGRSVGFVTSAKFREIEGEDAEIVPDSARNSE